MGQVNSQQDETGITAIKAQIEDGGSSHGNDDSATYKPTVSEKGKVSDVNNSKKIFVRLGTIRRRLARSLRTSKNSDHRKQIRDLLQNWTIQEIKSFVKEYEGLEALKDLIKLSDGARFKCNSLKDDMEVLYEESFLSNASIEYKGDHYCVHKNFLIARHKFFTSSLNNKPNAEGNYHIPIKDLDIHSQLLNSLLRYIYTGTTKDMNLLQILPQLDKKFGHLNPLEVDMKAMYDKSLGCDVKLIFDNQPRLPEQSPGTTQREEEGLIENNNLEVYCHSFVLCARSNFFESCLMDRFQSVESRINCIDLTLSEKIIPRSYIRVVLNCFYTDTVDISSIIKWKVADDGSGEADRLLTTSELAMELYEIGHFLEFPKLMQGCEDIVIANLNISTLLNVLEWSFQPFGSTYVHRQAMQYLREEFNCLCKAAVFLANIPKKFLLEAIKCDFVQANEEFILATVVKWGEWQIAKANEKPGTSPANSLPRRSPKRRDIDNKILLDIICDLLSHVRLKHILPSNSSVLHSCYQRRLLQRPFPFDVLASEKNMPSMAFWLRDCRYKHYQRPRLFTQYVHEVKMVLHERLTENDHNSCASRHHTGTLPDMLPLHRSLSEIKPMQMNERDRDLSASVFDIIQLASQTIRQMMLREKELKTSEETLKALCLAPDSYEISNAIQLRVVREFGLPDEVAGKLFQQTPDLIEESTSSSSSSKHSTLSRVGLLMKDVSLSREASSVSNDSCVSKISHLIERVPTQEELLQRTSQLLNKDKDALECSYDNPLVVDQSPVRSIEDSPLDLPLTESTEITLPNVLLDTT